MNLVNISLDVLTAYALCLIFIFVKFFINIKFVSIKNSFRISVSKLFILGGWGLIHFSFIQLFNNTNIVIHWCAILPISLYGLHQFIEIGEKIEKVTNSEYYLIKILKRIFFILEKGFFDRIENLVLKFAEKAKKED